MLKDIADRVKGKLNGGPGDPKAESDREKGDKGYQKQEGDKELMDRMDDALKKKGSEKDCPQK